jgi:hypothetical protein
MAKIAICCFNHLYSAESSLREGYTRTPTKIATSRDTTIGKSIVSEISQLLLTQF